MYKAAYAPLFGLADWSQSQVAISNNLNNGGPPPHALFKHLLVCIVCDALAVGLIWCCNDTLATTGCQHSQQHQRLLSYADPFSMSHH